MEISKGDKVSFKQYGTEKNGKVIRQSDKFINDEYYDVSVEGENGTLMGTTTINQSQVTGVK